MNPEPSATVMRPDGRRATLCLITDRRRLAAASGQSEARWPDLLIQQIRGAMSGGVDVIQIREPDAPGRTLTDLVRHVVPSARANGVRVVVNDRLDIALAADADGAHLPEAGLRPDVARMLTPSHFVIGRSVHSAKAAAASGSADYLIAGSIFATVSKPNLQPTLGLDGLADVVKAAGRREVWAIGGVTLERIRDVLATGAKGIAAIGAFLPACPTENVAQEVQEVTEKLRFTFDSSAGLP